MASTITLKFNSEPAVGTFVSLKPVDLLKETFVDIRTSPENTPISSFGVLGQVANYKKAFQIDYNQLNIFTIIANGDEVSITHPTSGYFVALDAVNTTSGAVTIVGVVDVADIVPINITDISFVQASSDYCTNVGIQVTTDVLATKVNSPVSIDPNASNPFSFDNLRGQIITIEVENTSGQTSSRTIKIPRALSSGNVSIGIINSPLGATATLEVALDFGLELEYSLDDINWQSSNIFSSLITGNYTAYVKDQLGCSIQKDFEIEGFEDSVSTLTPFIKISKLNSIRFAKIDSNLKNDENTLSCEAVDLMKRQEIQRFESSDVIPTQIETSYQTITVTVVKEDLTEVVIPTTKHSENIGIKDKRDAIKYNLGNGKTGIYFTSGDTYNYDTDVQNGIYTLNGGLPSWGVVGNYILLGLEWFVIEDLIFDESKDAEVLVISESYTGVDVSLIVGTVYNKENFEVYEFITNMINYLDDSIQINVTFTDPIFTDETHLSEIINVKEIQENTIKLEWYNEDNIGLFYETGIRNLLRLPFEYSKAFEVFESDNEKTDTSAYLVSSQVYEGEEFFFDLVTKEIKRKIFKAFAHKFVFINNIRYVISDSPEDSHLIGTNLYRVSVKMIKATDSYNSQVLNELTGENIDLIKLINSGKNYIEY